MEIRTQTQKKRTNLREESLEIPEVVQKKEYATVFGLVTEV
jgi:hypothetical protein